MSKRKKNETVCDPLEFTKNSDLADKLRQVNVDPDNLEEIRTYFTNTLEEEGKPELLEHAEGYATSVFTLMDWLKLKQCYKVTKELGEALFSMDDLSFPLDQLHLPFRTVYLDFSELPINCENDGVAYQTIGCFMTLGEVPYGEFTAELCSIVVLNKKCQILPEDIFPYAYGNMSFDADSTHTDKTIKDWANELCANLPEAKETMLRAILVAAYLSSQEPDVIENPVQKSIYRPSQKPRYGSVRKWDVGVRYTTEVRARKQQEEEVFSSDDVENNEKNEERKPERNALRPHIRRAHWHTYRIGKGRTERKVLWIPPTMVGVKTGEDMPVTMRQIGNGKGFV